jgi:hypothetical protein
MSYFLAQGLDLARDKQANETGLQQVGGQSATFAKCCRLQFYISDAVVWTPQIEGFEQVTGILLTLHKFFSLA